MTEDRIKIIDAHENNLKHIDVEIPKGQLVVLAGVSGSGKSSLAFGTVATEAAREWQQSYPMFLRNKMPHYDRPKVGEIHGLTPVVIVDQKAVGASSRSTVGTAVDVAPLLRLLFSRCGEPSAGGSMAYSMNHPLGMCPDCTGLGETYVLKEESLFDARRTLEQGAILFSQFSSGWQTHLYQDNPLLDARKPLCEFTEEQWQTLKYGSREKIKVGIKSNNTGRVDMVDYEGVVPRFRRLYLQRDISKLKKSLQEEILSHVEKGPCPACGGTGLNPAALASRIHGLNIIDMMQMTAAELLPVLQQVHTPMGLSIARQIAETLQRMADVGIGYLQLGRHTDTLSGGEAQRIKIVRNLGSSLTNITYIFDEPTAGLHPADAERIGLLLTSLRDHHNNVLVVEHSRQMIQLADHIIELGPEAGTRGGQITFEGSYQQLLQSGTVTAETLRRPIALNEHPLPWSPDCKSGQTGYEIHDAHSHNLNHVSVTVPKGVLTAITGVAGSGKSSLAIHELARRYPNAIVIDQKAIGTSIRSTPATYTGVMNDIRRLFARANGVDAAWFSSNSKGACPVCKGTGQITYDMAFAEPVVVVCEQCGGHRYSPTALSYMYKGKNIEEVMALTIEQAVSFFDDSKIRKKLQILLDVGLGYLTLGQPTSTLSGGEVQRIKLSAHLGSHENLYILDEPSTGLHSKNIELLLTLLRKLVSAGNTVVIVEHRLELVAQADWIIDMGPDGGTGGGEVIFTGTPRQLLECKPSKTAHYLRSVTIE